MDRHLEFQSRHTPTGEFLVPPPHPIPAVDLDAERAESAAGAGETFIAPNLQTDRLLERLTPRRVAEIRARLASGAYGSPEVLQEVAMRLLESGDLN